MCQIGRDELQWGTSPGLIWEWLMAINAEPTYKDTFNQYMTSSPGAHPAASGRHLVAQSYISIQTKYGLATKNLPITVILMTCQDLARYFIGCVHNIDAVDTPTQDGHYHHPLDSTAEINMDELNFEYLGELCNRPGEELMMLDECGGIYPMSSRLKKCGEIFRLSWEIFQLFLFSLEVEPFRRAPSKRARGIA